VKTWFTSDLHLGHRNIIGYCQRPFANVDEMNSGLIARWNDRVAPEYKVYVLGDFSLHGKAFQLDAWLAQLRGTKHLVRGNHDNRKALKQCRGWASLNELLDVTVEERKLRLFHYPIEDWRGPRVLLHGHRHSAEFRTGPFSRDVGVDPHGYRPIALADLDLPPRGE